MKSKKTFRDFLDLYLTFLRIGSFTIGGGLAMMPMMQKELIDKKKWITEEDLLDYYAIGQSTPGIVAVNVSTFVGYRQFGILGGFVATLGMVTPSIVIIMILATLINSIDQFPVVQRALKGVNIAVAALLTSVIVKFATKTVKKISNAFFMLLAFSLVFFLKVPSFIIILGAVTLGVIITVATDKKSKAKKSDSKSSDSKQSGSNQTGGER